MSPSKNGELLSLPRSKIRRFGPGNVLAVCWRQWRAERHLARRGICFRTTDPLEVAAAYAAMTPSEFDAINGRQDWANWRTIPRSLSGRVPDRSLRVLDLGCGTGGSTRVLACCCPLGSRITGYELAEPLLEVARRRTFAHHSGSPVMVGFLCQPVTERLAEAEASVDVVNASGVVGHHLTPTTVQPLVRELQRVLRPGGLALLDVGPTLSARQLCVAMDPGEFTALARTRSWFCDPTGQVVFAKKSS
jgi:SAM-dependent methyltransferase